jgi:hypothetical protein
MRAHVPGRWCRALAVLALAGAISGCAAALPLVASGIGSGAGYTILNIAHKTQTYPVQTVYRASLQALKTMGVKVLRVSEDTEEILRIEAVAKERDVAIAIEGVTAKATRLTVNVSRSGILKDKATAEEIIRQTEQVLAAAQSTRGAQASLVVNAQPAGARVRIMNIQPKFYQGILLSPGRYHIRVSMRQDKTRKTKNRWVTLGAGEDKILSVELVAPAQS